MESEEKRGGYGPVSAVVVSVTVYLASQLVGALLIGIYPLIKRWNSHRAEAWLASSVYGQFALMLIIDIVAIYLIRVFLHHRHRRLRDIGLKWPVLRDVGYAIGGFVIYFFAYAFIIKLVPQLFPSIDINQKQDIGFSTTTTGSLLIPVFISLVILPPLAEEIVCRGFLYTGLKQKLTKVVAAIITSALFAFAHLQWGNSAPLLWVAAIDTFVLSLVLVYVREKSDSLAPAMMIHMAKNFVAFYGLFILKLS